MADIFAENAFSGCWREKANRKRLRCIRSMFQQIFSKCAGIRCDVLLKKMQDTPRKSFDSADGLHNAAVTEGLIAHD